MNNKITKMKQGRRIAYLKRCIKAWKLMEYYENQTVTRRRIFESHIKPVLNCSYQSFNRMLNVPNPEKQLKEFEKQTKK
jgi:hypothetical protein